MAHALACPELTVEGAVHPKGMPCMQCARKPKFWMSANTRALLLAPFDKFLVPYWGFF